MLLTGSLPPLLQPELEGIFLLGSAQQGLQYIRENTSRANVEYRVEVCNDADVEDKVCEIMQQARRNLSAGQRAVGFCRSRMVCERIARRLECHLYHRTFEEKEASLVTWVDGSEKIMIATSALGTGVDINGIQTVVHLNRPHSIVDFVQEVGRAGRSGEPVQSTIVPGKREVKWLRSEAAKEADWNREGLRLFLNEQSCRRARLSVIMDGEKVLCGEKGGRKCDSCRKVTDSECVFKHERREVDEAEEQDKRYAAGPQLWQARVRQQALERQMIERTVTEIGLQCAACWVFQKADASHRLESCPLLATVVDGEYWAKRRSIRFEPECRCCYHCSLPGDWCPWYSQGQKCLQPDVVKPIVLAGWGTEATREIVEQEKGGGDIDRVTKWIGKASRLGGTKALNSVRVAKAIIRSLKS